MSDTPAVPTTPMREALDELAEAFPVDEISDAPWVVEHGSIAWMIREGEGGPQVGNFILEADARWVAAQRNAIEAQARSVPQSEPEGLDVEQIVRAALRVVLARLTGEERRP